MFDICWYACWKRKLFSWRWKSECQWVHAVMMADCSKLLVRHMKVNILQTSVACAGVRNVDCWRSADEVVKWCRLMRWRSCEDRMARLGYARLTSWQKPALVIARNQKIISRVGQHTHLLPICHRNSWYMAWDGRWAHTTDWQACHQYHRRHPGDNIPFPTPFHGSAKRKCGFFPQHHGNRVNCRCNHNNHMST